MSYAFHMNLWVDPPFETEIIEEDERTTPMRDHWGVKELVKKDAPCCAPAYIEWPVKNRADWEKLKEECFQPGIETRIPPDYPELIKELNKRDFPLVIGGYSFGFYGGLRFLFGMQNLSYMFYDDPQLIKDIQNHLADLWIEVGITGSYPLEVKAGMDVVKMREQFPKFQMMGGVDKLQLMKGKSEIDVELNRLPGVIKQGGDVPHVDHSVPDGVPWENFKYYREELLKIIEGTPVLS